MLLNRNVDLVDLHYIVHSNLHFGIILILDFKNFGHS